MLTSMLVDVFTTKGGSGDAAGSPFERGVVFIFSGAATGLYPILAGLYPVLDALLLLLI